MKVIALVFFIVGASAQYGIPDEDIPIRAAPIARMDSYSAPIVRVATPAYSAPAVRVVDSYAAPVVRTAYEPVRAYQAVEVRRPHVPIVKLAVDNDNYGTYHVESITGDGSSSVENANLRNLGDPEGPVSVSSGVYSFVGDDGRTYTTRWVADENGFRAEGDHLPTPPPIPVEIQKSLVENSYGGAAVRVLDSYSAPAVRVLDTYSAPAIRVAAPAYSAPAVRVLDTYSAPAVRVSSY